MPGQEVWGGWGERGVGRCRVQMRGEGGRWAGAMKKPGGITVQCADYMLSRVACWMAARGEDVGCSAGRLYVLGVSEFRAAYCAADTLSVRAL